MLTTRRVRHDLVSASLEACDDDDLAVFLHDAPTSADDDRIYLVDFGLATPPRFDLSDAERRFVAHSADHDAVYAAMRLVNWLATMVGGVPMPASGGPAARDAYVRRCASGDIPQDVPAAVAVILARHAPAAAQMNDFCWRLFDGDIHAQYPGPTVSANPRRPFTRGTRGTRGEITDRAHAARS